MFINHTQLKKLMKRDYKETRLTIGAIDDGLSIMGSTWLLHIVGAHVPNIVKSIAVELAGILPDQETIFTVSKNNPDPQYELDTGEGRCLHVIRRWKNAINAAYLTNVYEEAYGEMYGMIQSNVNGRMVCVRKELLDLIDLEAVNYDFEDAPGNPCYSMDLYNGIIWHNATTTLLLLPTKRESRIEEPLSHIVFNPDMSDFISGEDGTDE